VASKRTLKIGVQYIIVIYYIIFMITFKEWLDNSESIEEWKKLGALALAGASFLPQGVQAQPPNDPQAAIQTQSQNQQARLDAMKRVSSVHRFKKNWGSEFGPKEDQKLFDSIMKLQTEEDHDDFIKLCKKSMNEIMRVQQYGSKSKKEIYNSYAYQYQEYLITLAMASEINSYH
jgi:hypothetical protein